MKIQYRRAGSVLALGALLSVAGGVASTAQSARRSEKSLLGFTLLRSTFRDVLKHYGRPDEIQAGGPYVPVAGAPGSAAPSGGGSKGGPPMMGGSGGMMGGAPAMGGGGGGGGKKSTSKNGFLGRSGSGAGGPGGAPGMMGGSSGGGPSMMGGLPGFGGSGGMMGGSGGMMGSGGPEMPGMAGPGGPASGGADASAEQAEYEATWWYHDKTNGLHKSFLFNKDGHLIQIQEYGHDKNHKGGKTRLGVGLGSSMTQVLRTYGWSNDGANDGRNVIMRFGGEDKIAFQLVDNRVVGITVAVVKDITPAAAP